MSNAWVGVSAGRVDRDEGLFMALLPVSVCVSVNLFVKDMKKIKRNDVQRMRKMEGESGVVE